MFDRTAPPPRCRFGFHDVPKVFHVDMNSDPLRSSRAAPVRFQSAISVVGIADSRGLSAAPKGER
jgi:hypothetical protein